MSVTISSGKSSLITLSVSGIDYVIGQWNTLLEMVRAYIGQLVNQKNAQGYLGGTRLGSHENVNNKHRADHNGRLTG